MKLDKLVLQKEKASKLYQQYKEHKGQQTDMDREIESVYRHIAAGEVVIRAVASIQQAGVGDDNRPKLAICRADSEQCYWEPNAEGGGCFENDRWLHHNAHWSRRISIPKGSFPEWPQDDWHERNRRRGVAMVPLIPVYLRPKAKLSNYHVLFEAEWKKTPPRDPVLLRRIVGDSWLVLAAWDLTDVEMAAMANRLNA